MFWNIEAVNRSSNCNPGSQTVCSKSLSPLFGSAQESDRDLAVFPFLNEAQGQRFAPARLQE